MIIRARQGMTVIGVLVGAVVTLAAAGCGSDPTPDGTTRPLSAAEAARMAEVLFDNFEAGGAQFEASASGGPGQGSFTLRGEVDWSGPVGAADVLGGSPDAPVTGVFWNDRLIGERRPDLDPLVAGGLADNEVPLLSRPPDLTNRRLDQVVAVVTGLAATQRDNAQLIAQTPGSAFVRNDVLRGRDVEVLRYGQRSIYWLDAATGEMMRFEGSDSSGRYPVVVDLYQRGPRRIELPPGSALIDVASIADAYGTLAPTSP